MFGLSDGIRSPDENRFFTLKDCSLGLPNLPLRLGLTPLILPLLTSLGRPNSPSLSGSSTMTSSPSRTLPKPSLLILVSDLALVHSHAAQHSTAHAAQHSTTLLTLDLSLVQTAAGMDALYIANKAINNLVLSDPSSWDEAKSVTRSYLGSYTVSTRGAQDQDQEEGARHQVYAIGHCHIDTAWLWPFSETRRKTARSWSSQLRIMERFPEHAFAASSAQQVECKERERRQADPPPHTNLALSLHLSLQYEWLMEDYPGLFKRIQGAAGVFDASPDADAGALGGVLGGADGPLGVNKGFIPVGGSWVEMDANLPSGESIVRQFLYGQRFFKRHFKKTSEVFWLPDTFGYCAQLPQIMSKAGFKYFLTQKLSWNNINTFPHNTFYWRALDGQSQVTLLMPLWSLFSFTLIPTQPSPSLPLSLSLSGADSLPSCQHLLQPGRSRGCGQHDQGQQGQGQGEWRLDAFIWIWRRRGRAHDRDDGEAETHRLLLLTPLLFISYLHLISNTKGYQGGWRGSRVTAEG